VHHTKNTSTAVTTQYLRHSLLLTQAQQTLHVDHLPTLPACQTRQMAAVPIAIVQAGQTSWCVTSRLHCQYTLHQWNYQRTLFTSQQHHQCTTQQFHQQMVTQTYSQTKQTNKPTINYDQQIKQPTRTQTNQQSVMTNHFW